MIMFYGFFYQVKTVSYCFVNDQHDYFEMTIVDQGELVHEVEGLKHVAKRHDCMLYYPNQRHSQMVKKDGVSTYLSIMFQASGISPELKNKIVHLSNHYTQVIEKMVELSNRPSAPFYADEMITLFKSVIIQMLKSDQAFYDEPSSSSTNYCRVCCTSNSSITCCTSDAEDRYDCTRDLRCGRCGFHEGS